MELKELLENQKQIEKEKINNLLNIKVIKKELTKNLNVVENI